jgi:hypothetical protein
MTYCYAHMFRIGFIPPELLLFPIGSREYCKFEFPIGLVVTRKTLVGALA